MSTKNPSVLVADDERALRDFVSENLSARGFDVLEASTGLETLALFNTKKPDLIILDIMMPNMDGFETCRRIRKTSTVPIIVLSALDEDQDIVQALDLGADDYLTKPFSVTELMARVRAAVRRSQWQTGPDEDAAALLDYDVIQLDPTKMTVDVRGKSVNLTRTEFAILQYLMEKGGAIVPHYELLEQIWGPNHGHQPEYMRVYIGRIRRKIERDPSRPEFIISEYGQGYRFGLRK